VTFQLQVGGVGKFFSDGRAVVDLICCPSSSVLFHMDCNITWPNDVLVIPRIMMVKFQ